MADFFKDAKPDSLKDIMGGLTKKIGLDFKMRESVFFNSWSEIVGFRFKNNTRAVMIKSKNNINTLVVAVKSPVISQELFLFKKDLLNKIENYSKPLGLIIDDIYFDAKLWREYKKEEHQSSNDEGIRYLKEPYDIDLEHIEIPTSILEDIEKSLEKVHFGDENLKNRMKKLMIKDVKSEIWKKENNYPSCEKCGITLNYIIEGEPVLCPSCKYND